jgi:uncharacterized protein
MPGMSAWELAALCGAGVAAGFINVMAGGGSFLTLPALMLLGLPADVANGTNRVGILVQSLTGSATFYRGGVFRGREVLFALIPSGLGALVGAIGAALTPAFVLKPVLLTMLIVMALWITLRPKSFSGEGEGDTSRAARRKASVALFGAGLYGGFVQAGVGFMLLGAFAGVLGMKLTKANAMKLVCTALFSAVALAVFVAAGQVRWIPGLVLAVATTIGTQIGVRFALRAPQALLRWILLVAVFACCIAAFFTR